MPLGAVFWHTLHDRQNLITSFWIPGHQTSLMILSLVFRIPRCPFITDSYSTFITCLQSVFGTITCRICSPLLVLGCLYSRYHKPFLSSNVTSWHPFVCALVCLFLEATCLSFANAIVAFCRHPFIPCECSSPTGCSSRSFLKPPWLTSRPPTDLLSVRWDL